MGVHLFKSLYTSELKSKQISLDNKMKRTMAKYCLSSKKVMNKIFILHLIFSIERYRKLNPFKKKDK